MGNTMKAIILAPLLWVVLAGVAAASDLAAPRGEVILTVTGAISRTNGEGAARFDRAMLESLPQHGFITTSVWTEGARSYSGVLLKDLLEAVGATGGSVRATALNDYQITIPMDGITADAPLLAYLSDGKPMMVRDKGPLWIIYPFDDTPAYRTEQNYSRSVWQLYRLDVID
jgi:hypothetical protein